MIVKTLAREVGEGVSPISELLKHGNMGNISKDHLQLVALSVVGSAYWLFWLVLGPYRWLMYAVGLPLAFFLVLFFVSFANRYLVSLGAAAVAIFTVLMFTVGVTRTGSVVCQGIVVKKWTESSMAGYAPVPLNIVKVRCDKPEVLTFKTNTMPSVCNALEVGRQVEVAYHTESVLGMSSNNLVLESLDSRFVLSSGSVRPLIHSVVGLFPLSYLVYAHGICKASNETKRGPT